MTFLKQTIPPISSHWNIGLLRWRKTLGKRSLSSTLSLRVVVVMGLTVMLIAANTVAIKASTVAIKANTVAIKANTVAIKVNTVTIKANIVAIKANIVAIKASTAMIAVVVIEIVVSSTSAKLTTRAGLGANVASA